MDMEYLSFNALLSTTLNTKWQSVKTIFAVPGKLGGLIIEIDLEKLTTSASGKTLVVASTRGNAVTDVMVDGKPVTIGLKAYIKP
jgi:hypothetical protein